MKYYVDLGILGEEVAIEVEFAFTRYVPATREDPPEGGELYIVGVVCEKYPTLEGVIADHLQGDEDFLESCQDHDAKQLNAAWEDFQHTMSLMREMDEA